MNVDVMRKVDYWVGIPVCFILSLFNIFHKPKPIEKINKVLFLKLSEMGSTVLAYPAMKHIKDKGAEIFFLAFDENKEIIKTLGIVPEQNIITIRSKNPITLLSDTAKAIIKLRKEKLDATIDLEFFARATTIIAFFSGAKAHTGFYKFHAEGAGRGNFLTHKVNYNHYLHTAQSFLTLAYALDHDPKEIPMLKMKIPNVEDLEVPKWSTQIKSAIKMMDLFSGKKEFYKSKRKIIINPNSSQLIPFRKWPIEKWRSLCRMLVSDEGAVLIFMGTESDSEDAQDIIDEIETENNGDRIFNMTGRTTIPELLDMFNCCDLLISNDSGPAQFAAMTPIKSITIFGPETPTLYGPLNKNNVNITLGLACTPCISVFNMRRTPCKNNICLKDISVATVYEAYQKQMDLVTITPGVSGGGMASLVENHLKIINKLMGEKQ